MLADGVDLVDLAGLAHLFDMGFDLSQVLGEEVEQEGVDLRLELHCCLHIQHNFGLSIGVVVDGDESGSEDATSF